MQGESSFRCSWMPTWYKYKHAHAIKTPQPSLTPIANILWYKWNVFCEHDRELHLSFCTSPLSAFDSRLHCVLPISRNPSLEFRLLSPIQRLNQNDRCIPLLPQCSVTLKQHMNRYSNRAPHLLLSFSSFQLFSPPDPSSKWVLLGGKTEQWSTQGSEISAVDWSSACRLSVIAATTSARRHSAAAASPPSLPGPSCMFSVHAPQVTFLPCTEQLRPKLSKYCSMLNPQCWENILFPFYISVIDSIWSSRVVQMLLHQGRFKKKKKNTDVLWVVFKGFDRAMFYAFLFLKQSFLCL